MATARGRGSAARVFSSMASLVAKADAAPHENQAETQGVIEVANNPVSATFNPNYRVTREQLSLEQF